MAWAALIPIAAQLLSGGDKKQAPAGPQMPSPPSLGEIFAANDQKYSQPSQFGYPGSNPFSPIPTGGGSRGPNG
jgi:hypothetical protein